MCLATACVVHKMTIKNWGEEEEEERKEGSRKEGRKKKKKTSKIKAISAISVLCKSNTHRP